MRIRTLTRPIVLGALFATTPQLAVGQERIHFDARPGAEIQSDQLMEFLAKNLTVAFGTDMRPLSVTLRLEMISREEGVIGKYESEAVEVEAGRTYDGSTWLRFGGGTGDICLLFPGFCGSLKITFGRFAVINHEEQYVPRECGGATHALWIDVGQCDGCMAKNGQPMLCLNVEG